MKNLQILVLGVLFGTILAKSEVIYWIRIQEMFRFQSIHMYGIIGSAVITGMLVMWFIRRQNARSSQDQPMEIKPKDISLRQALIGGTVFGLGWALTGACPGPIFVQIGTGFTVAGVTLLSALVGTWAYAAMQRRLPH